MIRKYFSSSWTSFDNVCLNGVWLIWSFKLQPPQCSLLSYNVAIRECVILIVHFERINMKTMQRK